MKTSNLFGIFFFIILIFLYKHVLSFPQIYGGDYIRFFPELFDYLKHFAFSAWEPKLGLGVNSIGLLHYAPYNLLIGIAGNIIENTSIIERMFWWIPFFLLSGISSSLLFVRLFGNKFVWAFAPFIFLANTYVLMMIGGGQIAGVGLAYAIAPLVLLQAIHLLEHDGNWREKIKNSLIFSIVLSIQLMFDLRITYITLVGIGIYYFLSVLFSFKTLKNGFWVLILPGLVTLLLHAFWIIPMGLLRQNPIQSFGAAYTSEAAVRYFSFTYFENAVALLHPYWPENIFGKVGFMRSEFLIIPLLAFTSLLFIRNSKGNVSENSRVLFFAILGLIGAFLAKGANDPFGGVYVWLFEHFPGLIMFRDSTKWYTLVAVSYSVLIPFSIWKVYEWLQNTKFIILNTKIERNVLKYAPIVYLLLTTICLLLLLRPALLGQLSGTFKRTEIPQEYVTLNEFLNEDVTFGRTLWIPSLSRFADYKLTHPVVFGTDFLRVASPSAMVSLLSRSENSVRDAAIEYVVVPYDALGELFLSDRKYDHKQYVDTITSLEKVSWLERVSGFDQIAVFKLADPKDHFWSIPPILGMEYKQISPTEYEVKVINGKKGDKIIFAESYDQNWEARIGNSSIRSVPYNKLNSFILQRDGESTLLVRYTPQELVNIGLLVSGSTALVILALLFLLRKRSGISS